VFDFEGNVTGFAGVFADGDHFIADIAGVVVDSLEELAVEVLDEFEVNGAMLELVEFF